MSTIAMTSMKKEDALKELEALKKDVREFKTDKGRENESLHRLLDEAMIENERLKKQLDAKKEDNPYEKLVNQIAEDVEKRVGVNASNMPLSQSLMLGKVKTAITVKEERRELPKVSTLDPEGKILALVAEGKLDSATVISKITDMTPLSRIEVTNACKKLADEQILLEGKAADGRVTYRMHPDVEVKKE